jgi:hypothetical protein
MIEERPENEGQPGSAGVPDPDETVDREEDLAAAEAAAIGGRAGDEEQDPAWRPVEEAGGGEAEGFEQAEADLEEHAQHGDDFHYPIGDAFTAEEESDRASASYGDADRREPPEADLREDDVEDTREPDRPA